MLFCSRAVIIRLMPSQKRNGHPPYPLIPWWGLARCLELAPLRGLKIRNVAPVRPPMVDLFLLCPLWVYCLWTAISFVFIVPFLGPQISISASASIFRVHWLFGGSLFFSPSFLWNIKMEMIFPRGGPSISICISSWIHLSRFCGTLFPGARIGWYIFHLLFLFFFLHLEYVQAVPRFADQRWTSRYWPSKTYFNLLFGSWKWYQCAFLPEPLEWRGAS